MTGKPTLGHATRTQAVRELRASGMRNVEIARHLGISQNAVAGLLSRDRSRRELAPDQGKLSDYRRITLPLDTWVGLRRDAAHRDCSVAVLVCEIMGRVVADGLVNAVLDDGVTRPRRGRSAHD